MLSDADVNEAQDFIANVRGSFIGGSYIVKGRDANDIDLVVPAFAYDIGAFIDAGFRSITHADPDKYSDEELRRIHSVWEHGELNLNILVIENIYLPAYLGAVAAMQDQPTCYGERDQRVQLHVTLCKAVRDIAKGKLA